MNNSQLDNLTINTIRTLSMDAVQKANSGHPGAPMGAAAMAYALWFHILNHNPHNPSWINRDRFILSPGHASMLLYSILHLSGYKVTINDLKNFRQFNSNTPGHPEYGMTPGVELTTGPLGAGFAMGIGMAIAEAFLSNNINQDDNKIIDHYTYGIVSDGDLMEGVASEAASLAGTLQLGKIIYLYDDNKISIEGSTELSFTENVIDRFKSYNWHVIKINDGNNINEITTAIKIAQLENKKPSIIVVPTIIAEGSPNKAGTAASHGAPLGKEEVELTKENLNWNYAESFYVPDEVKKHFEITIKKGKENEKKWNEQLLQFEKKYPAIFHQWSNVFKNKQDLDWIDSAPVYNKEDRIATRSASGDFLNFASDNLINLIGGSADLGPSNNTHLKNKKDFSSNTHSGNNIHFGVREHAMGNIINGIYLHKGIHTFTGTFLVFSDYMKPAIRLAALQNIPAKFIFTHDSIGLGEDGPTHQPIEHLASLRAIPRLEVYRPADANETIASWQEIFRRNKPSAIILTRQKVKTISSQKQAAKGVSKGAYIILDSADPEIILLATGSEVQLAVEASKELSKTNIGARVISMPSWELFEEQSFEYKQSIIPNSIKTRIAIEAGSSFGWHKYVQDDSNIISINNFGASAPAEELFSHFGFTKDNLIKKILSLLNKN
jgi:transketolase